MQLEKRCQLFVWTQQRSQIWSLSHGPGWKDERRSVSGDGSGVQGRSSPEVPASYSLLRGLSRLPIESHISHQTYKLYVTYPQTHSPPPWQATSRIVGSPGTSLCVSTLLPQSTSPGAHEYVAVTHQETCELLTLHPVQAWSLFISSPWRK